MNLKILELGNYIAPAYAGMILAEQGHYVEKWVGGTDPIFELRHGRKLWEWINAGKTLVECHPRDGDYQPFDAVIDNFRPSTLERWGTSPETIASRHGIRWVSLRSEVKETSFDVVAQCRSIGEFCPWIPFYLGDTAAGLWMAFKVLTGDEPGHFTIGQASCLQKLVEGELVIDIERHRDRTPWDTQNYYITEEGAQVEYKGKLFVEPIRDREWKLAHLDHVGGRMRI